MTNRTVMTNRRATSRNVHILRTMASVHYDRWQTALLSKRVSDETLGVLERRYRAACKELGRAIRATNSR